jgi:phage terminase small subunit
MGRRGPLPRNQRPPSGGPPTPPKNLAAAAREEWDRLVDELSITREFRALTVQYIRAWEEWTEARGEIGKATGDPTRYVKERDSAREYLLRCLDKLGGTPAARARIPSAAPLDIDREKDTAEESDLPL